MNKDTINALSRKEDYEGLIKYLEVNGGSLSWLYEFIRASDAYRHANRSNKAIYEKYAKVAELGSELLISLQPTNAKYLALRGLVSHHNGNFKDALFFYTKAHELEPDNLSYQNDVANALKALERFDDAEKIYIKLLETKLRVGVLYNLTMLHLFQGNLKEAKRYAKEYKKEDSKDKIETMNRIIERVLEVEEFNDKTLDFVFR